MKKGAVIETLITLGLMSLVPTMTLLAALTLSGCAKAKNPPPDTGDDVTETSEESVEADDAETDTGLSAEEPTEIMGAISDGITVAASGSDGSDGFSRIRSNRVLGDNKGLFEAVYGSELDRSDVDQYCDEHASPIALDGEPAYEDGKLYNTYPQFTARRFHCIMADENAGPESIPATIASVQGIICLFEKSGNLSFDGVERELDISTIFNNQAVLDECHVDFGEDAEALASLDWTIYSSDAPTLFSNMEREVRVVVSTGGIAVMDYAVAAKVENNAVTIVSRSGTPSVSQYDGFAGSLDFTTGELRFENKADRYEAIENGSSGGWSKRTKIFATLVLDGENPVGLISLEGYYSEAQNGAVEEGHYGAQFQTIKGDLENGLKTHSYGIFGIDQESIDAMTLLDPANYAEVTNDEQEAASDLCFSVEDGTCEGNDGLELPADQDMGFLMVTGGDFENVWDWAEGLEALDFDEVNLE